MSAEILFALKHQSPMKILGNIRAMKSARAPIRGYVTTTCFWTLLDAGVMDVLENQGTIDVGRFCEDQGLDPHILNEVCRYLARLGYMTMADGSLALTERGRQFWRDTQGVMNIFFAYEGFFKNLPGFLKRQASLSETIRRDDSVARGFQETGPRLTFDILAKLISRLDVQGVIELGCGNIDLTSYLARINDQMHFLGIEWDERYLEQARKTSRENQWENRVRLLQQDIFQLPASREDFSSYQLVAAIDLFHGYFFHGPEELLGLFKTLREAFAGKRFLISEVCLPDEERMKALSYPHVEHELFHALTGQKTFRAGELESLLSDSGFDNVTTWSVRNLGARIFVQCDA